jgi:hypothetical protein
MKKNFLQQQHEELQNGETTGVVPFGHCAGVRGKFPNGRGGAAGR